MKKRRFFSFLRFFELLDLFFGLDQLVIGQSQPDRHVFGKNSIQQQQKVQFFITGALAAHAVVQARINCMDYLEALKVKE